MSEENKKNLQIIETALMVYAFDNNNADSLTEVNFQNKFLKLYINESLACSYWYVKKSPNTLV
jgi:hypothetical protein